MNFYVCGDGLYDVGEIYLFGFLFKSPELTLELGMMKGLERKLEVSIELEQGVERLLPALGDVNEGDLELREGCVNEGDLELRDRGDADYVSS